jgi:hypothetical protein
MDQITPVALEPLVWAAMTEKSLFQGYLVLGIADFLAGVSFGAAVVAVSPP